MPSTAIRSPLPTKVKVAGAILLFGVVSSVLGAHAFPEDSKLGALLFIVGILVAPCAGVAWLGLLAQHFFPGLNQQPVQPTEPQGTRQAQGGTTGSLQGAISLAVAVWFAWFLATSGDNSRVLYAASLQEGMLIESATTSGIGERFLKIKTFGKCGEPTKDFRARFDSFGFFSVKCNSKTDEFEESLSVFSWFWF